MKISNQLTQIINKATTCNFTGRFDSARRWYPVDPEAVAYCTPFRSPSRAWPKSYWNALSTIKANVELGVITPDQARLVRSAKRLSTKIDLESISTMHDRLVVESRLGKLATKVGIQLFDSV